MLRWLHEYAAFILLGACILGGLWLAMSVGPLNRDARAVMPPGSPEHAAYLAEQALARAKPRPGLWARLRARLVLRRAVRHGDLIPRGYGFAYYRWETDGAVCYPIPLNLAVRWAHFAWLWFKRGGAELAHDPADAYEAGRRDERAQWLGYIGDPLG